MMNLWIYAGLIIGLAVTYFLVGWLFGLLVFLLILYIIYRIYRMVERMMTPHGRRIKHGLLRGHLTQEYGTKEGGKLYKEMVGELRKRGYR